MDERELRQQQVDIAKRLQEKWLKRMEYLLDTGEITSTDMATLARVLLQNGWSLDPNDLPQTLRDKLTKRVSFDDDLEGELNLRVM